VGEVEQHQYAVDHRIADRYDGIKAAPLQGIDEILEKIFHSVAAPVEIKMIVRIMLCSALFTWCGLKNEFA
jgi:hypothetical protein